MTNRILNSAVSLTRRSFVAAASVATIALGVLPASAQSLDEVTFGTNWKAQAEHGGFYQALATGIFEKHGLDVTIRMGGPQVNHSQLLAAGAIDFSLGQSNLSAYNYVKNDVPLVSIAAFFQKDLRVLLSHPDQGNDTLEDLVGKPILVADSGRITYWAFLKAKYGYDDSQIRPYTFNLAPFLVDTSLVQQGYLTAEPFALQGEGISPIIHLLSDVGYTSYASTIETSAKLIDENPDLVQRLVNASIEGWYSYLYGDPAPGNALIKSDNPEMTDDQIAYSISKMKEHGILESGAALETGIGSMTDARWQSFYDMMVDTGGIESGIDISKSYTLQFVNQGVGMDMRN